MVKAVEVKGMNYQEEGGERVNMGKYEERR